jgi:hypothetical protein
MVRRDVIMLKGVRYRYILSFLFMAAVFIAVLRARAYTVQYNGLIEVCSNGIAYVPLDTKFVKCNGIVRQVRKFTKTITEGEEPCKCPECCDGWCYVVVNSDPSWSNLERETATFGPIDYMEIYIVWLSC